MRSDPTHRIDRKLQGTASPVFLGIDLRRCQEISEKKMAVQWMTRGDFGVGLRSSSAICKLVLVGEGDGQEESVSGGRAVNSASVGV